MRKLFFLKKEKLDKIYLLYIKIYSKTLSKIFILKKLIFFKVILLVFQKNYF